MNTVTIFEAYEKVTYSMGYLDNLLIYPEDIEDHRANKARNRRQYYVFRARLAKILGIEEE